MNLNRINTKRHTTAWCLSIVAGLFWSVNLSLAGTLAEDFKYASGGLDGKNGGSGFAGAWGAAGTSFSTVNAAIDLSFTGGGYAIVQTNSSGSFYSAVAAPSYRGGVRVPSSPLTNAVWFSALMQVPDASGSGFVGFNSSNTNVSSAPYKYYPSSSYNVGISGSTLTVAVGQSTGGGGWTSYTATTNNGLTPGATHLILGRVVFQAYGSADCLQVWADPADLAHLGAPQWQEVTQDIGANLFNLTVGAGGSGAVDAIRFSDGNGNETNAYVAVTGTTNLNPFTPPSVPPSAPTGLSALASNALVTLNWNVAATATSYNVYRSSISGGSYAAVTNQSGTTFRDADVVNGQTYFYVVTAQNTSGESTNSIEVSATPAVTNQFAADDFNYPSGSLSSLVCNGGTGWAGAWATNPSTTRILISGNNSLIYTGGGYSLVQSNVSGSVYGDFTSYRGTQRTLATPAAGDVWFSALMMASNSASQAYLGFNSANTNIGSPGISYLPSTTYSFGISNTTLVIAYGANNSSGNWSSFVKSSVTNLTVGQPHLMLGHLSLFQAYTLVQLWADPADLTQLGLPAWTEVTHNVGSNIWNVCVGGVSGGAVDAVRVSGNTFAYTDVTGATNLSTVALLPGFELQIFGDEFNGMSLDPNVWFVGGVAFGVNRTNVYLENGWMRQGNHILATNADGTVTSNGGTNNCVTGSAQTAKFCAKFGLYEARVRLEQGVGINNAYWTSQPLSNPWDDYENDIIQNHIPKANGYPQALTTGLGDHLKETPGSGYTYGWDSSPRIQNLANVNATSQQPGTNGFYYAANPTNVDWTLFHTYSMEWRADESLHYYLDGHEFCYNTNWFYNLGSNCAGAMIPQKIIFSTLYAEWAGINYASNLVNMTMDTDWVRVYQKPGWTGTADGTWTNPANWGPDGVPRANWAGVFNLPSDNTNLTFPADQFCQSLYFDYQAAPYTFTSTNKLRLGAGFGGRGGIIIASSVTNAQTFNAPIQAERELEIGNYSTTAAAALTFNGNITGKPGASNLIFLGRSSAPINLNSSLGSSIHNLQIAGSQLWLNSANGHSGTNFAYAGARLIITTDGALGTNRHTYAGGTWTMPNFTNSYTGCVLLASNVNYLSPHTLHIACPGTGGYSALDVLGSTNVTFAGAISIEDDSDEIGSQVPGGGLLRLTGPISAPPTNTLTFKGAGTISIEGNCPSTGTNIFQCATLAGTGTLRGPTTLADGKTLAPGGWNSLGTLTISNTLTIGGPSAKTIFRLSKDGGQTCDKISGLTSVTYAGSLVVTNLGSTALAVGDTFQLFSAGGYGGSFSAVTLPALAAPLAWNTANLAINGSIAVTGPTNPVIQPVIFDGTGTNLLLRVATQSGYNYVLQDTTDLTPPVVWVSQITNSGSGLTVTNAIPVSSGTPKQFYRYKVQ